MAPSMTPAWLMALPSARSGGLRYVWMALPADGIPPASATPNTARQPISPPSPVVKPVAIPAHDHKPTARLMPRVRPVRSMSIPANGALAA